MERINSTTVLVSLNEMSAIACMTAHDFSIDTLLSELNINRKSEMIMGTERQVDDFYEYCVKYETNISVLVRGMLVDSGGWPVL